MTSTMTHDPAGTSRTPSVTTHSSHQQGSSRKWLVLLLLIVGVAVGLWLGWGKLSSIFGRDSLVDVQTFTVAPRDFSVILREKGELKAAKSVEIKSEVEGRATIIWLIDEGMPVKKGDLLVELASDQIDDRIQQEEVKLANALAERDAAQKELEIQLDTNASDIRKAELEIELKSLALDKYTEGDWAMQLQDAEIAIEQAKTTLERAKEDWEAAKELHSRKFITDSEHDEAEFNLKKADWDLQKANLARAILKEYTRTADLRQKESELDEARKELDRVRKSAEAEEAKKVARLASKQRELDLIESQLAKLRAQKERCRVVAPAPGFVVYASENRGWGGDDNQIKEGATVYERQSLIELPDTSRMVVEIKIHETKTDRIAIGQPANITVEGIPGTVLHGVVNKIAVVAASQVRWLNPDLKEYETEILLDETDIGLKPGVTAHAEILVDRLEDVLAIPVQSVLTRGGRSYVFKRERDVIRPVEVKLGPSSTEWVQVVDGLEESDRIRIAVTDADLRLLPAARERPVQAPTDGAESGTGDANIAKSKGKPGAKPADSAVPRHPKAAGPSGVKSDATRATPQSPSDS